MCLNSFSIVCLHFWTTFLRFNLISSFLSIDGQARKKLGNLITHIQSRKEEQRARETKMAEVIWCFGEHDLSFSSLFLTSHSSTSFWPLQKFGCFLVDHFMRDVYLWSFSLSSLGKPVKFCYRIFHQLTKVQKISEGYFDVFNFPKQTMKICDGIKKNRGT